MSESELQFFLVCIIILLFVLSFSIAMRGFFNSTSWFCMMTAIGIFSQSLFVFPAAFIGNPHYTWVIGGEVSTIYLQIVVVSLASSWAAHLLTRKRISSWVNNRLIIPELKIKEKKLEIIAYYLSLGGSIVAIFSANAGLHGYFIEREFLQNPPIWLDSLRKILGLSIALSLIFFISSYKRSGSLNIRCYLLIILWILAGFFSGFKLEVVLPAIMLFISAWMTKRLSAFNFLFIGLSVILAYSVIEPMREIAIRSFYQVTPYDAFMKVVADPSNNDSSEIPDKLLDRLDYSTTAILVLTADRFNQIPNYKKQMMETYKLIPLLTFVPRAFWPEKPLQDLGRVLNIELYGYDSNSITPSGPVASYLVGGYIVVIFSSILFSIFLTFSGSLILRYYAYPARYLPILILAFSLSIGDTFFSYYLIKVLRIILFIYFFYFILRILKKTSPVRSTRGLM